MELIKQYNALFVLNWYSTKIDEVNKDQMKGSALLVKHKTKAVFIC